MNSNKPVLPFIIITLVCAGIIYYKTAIVTNDASNKMKENLKDYTSYAQTVGTKQPTFLRGMLAGHEGHLFLMADNYGVDPYLIGAIMHHETGNGTSKILRNQNNVGGLKRRTGDAKTKNGFVTFDSIDTSIERLCFTIAMYRDKYGRNTVEEIGSAYCNSDKGWARKVKIHRGRIIDKTGDESN